MKQSISHWGMHETAPDPFWQEKYRRLVQQAIFTLPDMSYDAQYIHQTNALDPKHSQAAAQKFY